MISAEDIKMQYFNSLPKVVYTDKNRIRTIYTNLLARVSVKPSLLNNLLVFYEYDIQDEDTPEIVAYKYYGDINRFWIVLYCNQMLDPLWDWPLSSRKFEQYVLNKYDGALDNIHHYEKITTMVDNSHRIVNTDVSVISEEDYNNLPYNYDDTYTISGETLNVNIRTKVVTNYEYEVALNDSKRSIKILNKDYASQLEKEFVDLMKPNG